MLLEEYRRGGGIGDGVGGGGGGGGGGGTNRIECVNDEKGGGWE